MGDLTNLARQFLKEQAVQQPGASQHDLTPGCLIHWQGMDGVTRGPAVVRGTLDDHGQTWCWFTFDGTDHLTDVRLIVKCEPDLGNMEGGSLAA